MKPKEGRKAQSTMFKEKFLKIGIPEEWVEPLIALGYDSVTKLREVEKHTKLHQDLCGYNKKNKAGLKNPSPDDVKAWLS